MFYRKCYTAVIIDVSKWWIVFKLESECLEVVICFLYFKPSLFLDYVLDLLQVILNVIVEKYEGIPIVIGGDVNARVGESGLCTLESLINTNFSEYRSSLDKTVDTKGRILLEFMSDNSFVLLNGRAPSDIPAQYTHVGTYGSSVIDQVYCLSSSLHLMHDLKVLQFPCASDHFPVILSVAVPLAAMGDNMCIANQNSTFYVWNPYRAAQFVSTLEYSPAVGELTVDIESSYNNLLSSVRAAASAAGMSKVVNFNVKNRMNKPWFDKECLSVKRQLGRQLRICRRTNFEQSSALEYLRLRGVYRRTLRSKKCIYQRAMVESLSNVENQSSFWRELKRFKRTPGTCSLSLSQWENFYAGVYPPRIDVDMFFLDARHPFLDSDITMLELTAALRACKSSSSPGADQIGFEFLKALPQNWILYLLVLFNRIFHAERVPTDWSNILLVMLHKKGPVCDPNNYRGIALVNCTMKAFTQILLNRLTDWCSDGDVLPECQSGFRPSRGCADNVFVLMSIVHIHVRLRGRHVYAAFIDFKRAFDSVSHVRLWNKLHRVGVSSRIIRLCQQIYNQANIRIKVNNVLSLPFEVTTGVLQGEPLSPLFFSLFIADIEEYFRLRGAQGLNVDGVNDIMMLLYADDLVLLSDSPSDLNKKLGILNEYAELNGLEVNIDKTKVIEFGRGYSKRLRQRYYFGGRNIDVVGGFNYLGVWFSSSALFSQMSDRVLHNAKSALGSVMNLMADAKVNSWEARRRLYEALLLNTLFHCVGIWGLRYTDQIERVQVGFFKRLLLLPKNTPNYLVRLEVGAVQLASTIFKAALSWLCRLRSMSESRYPKLVFKRLCQLDASFPANTSAYNWVTQLRTLVAEVEPDFRWDIDAVCGSRSKLISSFQDQLFQRDLEGLTDTSYTGLYKHLTPAMVTPAAYLCFRMPIYVARVISQLRLSHKIVTRFYFEGKAYSFRGDEDCSICNLRELESLEHILFRCPIYASVRPSAVAQVTNLSELAGLLRTVTPSLARVLCGYIVGICKIKEFVTEQ